MKKTAKRLVSLLLCVVMVLGILSVGVSAERSRPFRYVALGDSTSMGYMLNDFDDTYVHDGAHSSKYSTYAQMVEYLTKTWKIQNLEALDMTMTGTRPEELRAILDADYYYARCDTDHDHSVNYLDQHVDYYFQDGIGWSGYEELHDAYTKALSEADLVTYDLLMSCLGTYFGYRIQDMDDDLWDEDTLANLFALNDRPVLAKSTEKLQKQLEDALDGLGLPADTVISYLDMLLYTYVNLCINFSESMELIYKLNPDVSVIVVGPFNFLTGAAVEIGGVQIEMAPIWNIVLNAIENYVILLDKNCWRYRYADLNGGVELVIEALTEDGYLQEHNFRKEFYAQLGVKDIDALSPETQALYDANVARAAAVRVLPIADAMSNMGNKEMILRALQGEGSELDYAVLHMTMRFSVLHATGSHPSEKGYEQKFKAVKRALLSPVAANGTYLTGLLDGIIGIVPTVLGALLWNEECIARITGVFKAVFTPLIRFPSLFEK